MTIAAQDDHSSTILVVDDDPAGLGVIVDYLKERGFRVIVSRDGESGLKRADYMRPDLILLDVRMPGIDGVETCRRLKANEHTNDIPVIFLTALSDTIDKVKGFEAGGVDYITKPFQVEEALARIRTHVILRRLQQQLAEKNTALHHLNDELEERVRERTAELVDANTTLKREIEERKRVEEQLRAAMQEIHHRTKNNMQVIASLLEFQSAAAGDERFTALFHAIRDRIKSMALVHEKLHHSDLTSVNLKEYIEELTRHLMSSYQIPPERIALRFETEPVILSIDAAVPCGLMLNELLSNAIKHAFPEENSGDIHVALRTCEDGRRELRVSDNGVGLPEDFDLETSQSLGLKLVLMITEHQLRGTVECHRKTPGTEIMVRFKEPYYKPRIST